MKYVLVALKYEREGDRNRPSAVDKVHDCMLNYKLAGIQRDPQYREFIREHDGRAPFAQFRHFDFLNLNEDL